MKKYILIVPLVIACLALALCCWSVARNAGDKRPGPYQAARTFRENLAYQAGRTWGKERIRMESLRGPDDALALVLQGAEGSCTEPAIHLLILNTFGSIEPVKTITCNEKDTSITVEVRPYLDLIRATFPMVPREPDTKIVFGGTVIESTSYPGRYARTRFKSRQELIDYLQIEPRGLQFSTPSAALHERGFRLYASEHDDRILIIETTACDMLTYRVLSFSSTGTSDTTIVKWTELGGTFMVCKGERDMGLLSMRAASESIGLYPVTSRAECVDRGTMHHCN